MSCLQITGSQPRIFVPNQVQSLRLPSRLCLLPRRVGHQAMSICPKVVPGQAQSRKYQQNKPVCLFVGKGESGANNEEMPWNSLEKDMETSNREMSIEDVLKEQILKKEYYKEGGKGNTPRGGGGGGRGKGGGGGRSKNGDGSGESDDKDFAKIVDETVQVVLATMGFIFVYVYMITGEELIRLTKDYMKYLSGGGKSARLIRAMDRWENFYQKLTEKKIVDDMDKEMQHASAWWNNLTKWTEISKAFPIAPKLQSQSQQSKSG